MRLDGFRIYKKLFMLSLAVLLLCSPLAVWAEGEANPVYEKLRDGVADYFVLEDGEDAENAVHAQALIDFTEYTNQPSSTDGFRDIELVYESRFKVPYQAMWDKKVSNLAYIMIYDKASGALFTRTGSEDSYETVTMPVDGIDQTIEYTYFNEINCDYYTPENSQELEDCYCLVTVTSTFKTSVPQQHTGFMLMLGAADQYAPGQTLEDIYANPATWYVHFGTQEEEDAIVHDEELQSRFSTTNDYHQGKNGLQSLIKQEKKEASEQVWQAIEAKLMPLVPLFAIIPILILLYSISKNWKKQRAEEDSDAEKYWTKQQAALEEYADNAEEAISRLRSAIEHKEEYKQEIRRLISSPHFGQSDLPQEKGYWEATEAFWYKGNDLVIETYRRLKDDAQWVEKEGFKITAIIDSVRFNIMNTLHRTMIKHGIPRYLVKNLYMFSWKWSSEAGTTIEYSLFPNDYRGRTYEDFTGVETFKKRINDAYQFDYRGLSINSHKSVRPNPEPVHEVSVFSAMFSGAAWLFALIVWVLSMYYHIGAKSTGFMIPLVIAKLKGIYFWVYAAIAFAIIIWLGNILSGLLVKDKSAKYHNDILRKEEAAREQFLTPYEERISSLSEQANDAKQEIFATTEYQTAIATEKRLHQEDLEFLNRWIAVWRK